MLGFHSIFTLFGETVIKKTSDGHSVSFSRLPAFSLCALTEELGAAMVYWIMPQTTISRVAGSKL